MTVRLVDETSVITTLWMAPADAGWITSAAVIAATKTKYDFRVHRIVPYALGEAHKSWSRP